MALHIDLYHEIRAEHLARRRDPLKIAMLAAIVVAVILVGYYGIRLRQSSVGRAHASEVVSNWKLMSEKMEKAKAREVELETNLKTADALVERIEKRFYWAPVLAQIFKTVPREVQILKIDGDATSEGSKKCTLVIHGISAGVEPRTIAESLRIQLANEYSQTFPKATSLFRSLEDSAETVQLDGQKYPTALFSIHVDLPKPDSMISGAAKVAATPPAAPTRSKR